MFVREPKKGFDVLSYFYDFMLRSTSGSLIPRSEQSLLDRLEPPRHVLIVGGGTGEFLLALVRLFPLATVHTMDISPRMLRLSREKIRREFPGAMDRVRFVTGSAFAMESLDLLETYDLICTNFFLDLFEESELETLLGLLKSRLAHNGIWYCTDFAVSKERLLFGILHTTALWFLYRFFRFFAGISGRTHIPLEPRFVQRGLVPLEQKEHGRGFIRTTLYRSV